MMRFILFFLVVFTAHFSLYGFQIHPTQLLIRGVEAENIEAQTIKTLIAQGADINAVYFDKQQPAYNYFQPVHIAALRGNDILLKALVANGANLTSRIKYPHRDTNPQRYLYQNYNAAMLIAQDYEGIDTNFLNFVFYKNINHRDYQLRNGENLLHAALKTPKPNPFLIKYLLRKGCNPLTEAKNGAKISNLYNYFATEFINFDTELAQLLYDKGLKKLYDIDSTNYLYYCIKNNRFDLLKFVVSQQLVDLKNSPHPIYKNPLAAAAYHNHFAIFYYLWERYNYPSRNSPIGQETLNSLTANANKIYEKLLKINELSDAELYFFNTVNTNLYKNTSLYYEPFRDSIFSSFDSNIVKKNLSATQKKIYLIGSIADNNHNNILANLTNNLSNCKYQNYIFVCLNYTIYTNNTPIANTYGDKNNVNYFQFYVNNQHCLAKELWKGIYLIDENNIIRAKIPIDVFYQSAANYSLLFDAFFRL